MVTLLPVTLQSVTAPLSAVTVHWPDSAAAVQHGSRVERCTQRWQVEEYTKDIYTILHMPGTEPSLLHMPGTLPSLLQVIMTPEESGVLREVLPGEEKGENN